VHWYNKDTCYKQTNSKEHFDIYKNYISKNILKYKTDNIFYFSNIVINKYNYREVLKILKFIKSSYPITKQILISNIAPE
jgi:hypothetical protein